MPQLFSVVVPAHQAAAFIGRTLGCVLSQTFTDFEVIVLDNGSTDGTGDVVASFDDERIRYCWQEDSGLPANSRNAAVSLAEGDYIAFLDADDLWRPEKLERVADALARDPAADVVAHGVDVVTPEGKRVGVRSYGLEPGDVHAQLLYRGNFLTTSAVTVRRAALAAAGGFDERAEYVTVEDYDLWLRLARDGRRFAVLPEILGSYLVHPGGASANLVRHYDNQFRVLDTHFGVLARAGRLDGRLALRRRRRARLAEVRDLARSGALGPAIAVLFALPGEMRRSRREYAAASRR